MDQREDQKEGEPLSETKDQSKGQSNKPEDDRKHGRKRKREPSAESWRSDCSKNPVINFKSDHPSATERGEPEPGSSCSPGRQSEMDQPPSVKDERKRPLDDSHFMLLSAQTNEHFINM
ncbi:hypothetical protein CHARACLAT_024095 [Characodon lateralis]|uniref:Uncharacterized protein n=1 Tax=Characodon lateralis TaxID=208331 RepID=A0ABU7E3H1_9TELE|nr:hypothetical protein [Characodon lateralis]